MKSINKQQSVLLAVLFLVMFAAGCYHKVPEKIKVDWFPDHSEIPTKPCPTN